MKRLLRGVALGIAALALVPAAAQAAVPPVVSASIAPDATATGTPVALTFTVANVDEVPLTGVQFSVALAPGLVVATANAILTSCDGAASAAPGGSSISLAAATLAPAGVPGDACFVQVSVVAPAVGLFEVASGPPSANENATQPGVPSNTVTLRVLDITTAASAAITLGSGQLSDSAVVGGPVAAQPGANVTFSLYGPDDPSCAGAPAFVSTVPYPTTGGPVTSAPFSPAAAGVYRWRAVYSNDGAAATVTGACNAPGEATLVSPAAVAPPPPPPPPGPSCAGKPATIVATAGRGIVRGTPRADVIVGTATAETIDGLGGDDTICAGDGNDRVRGSGGDDLLLGEGGNDDVRGGSGDDRLAGGNGPDRVDGGAGNDVLDEQNLGGGGHDRLFGGPGRDIVRTAGGLKDKINCGTGADRLTLDRFDRQTGCELRIVLPPPIGLPG